MDKFSSTGTPGEKMKKKSKGSVGTKSTNPPGGEMKKAKETWASNG